MISPLVGILSSTIDSQSAARKCKSARTSVCSRSSEIVTIAPDTPLFRNLLITDIALSLSEPRSTIMRSNGASLSGRSAMSSTPISMPENLNDWVPSNALLEVLLKKLVIANERND